MIRASAIAVLALILAGCNSQTLSEVGQAPSMSPVGSGLAYGETPQMAAYPKQPPPRSSSFSLWDDRRSKLFQDARAMSASVIFSPSILPSTTRPASTMPPTAAARMRAA
jgi:flagellar L-ring protein precursor FlgH